MDGLGGPVSTSRPVPRQIQRASLLFGCGIAILVAFCAALAWPPGSMVAAQPAATSTGDVHWIRLFAAAQIVAFGLYALGLAAVRWRPPRATHVIVVAAIIQLLPLAAPLMLSTDAYSYWNAGRLAAVQGANPYLDVPGSYPEDASFSYTPPEWRDRPTVYGPAFTIVSEAVAAAVGDSASLAAWFYKALAGASLVVLTVVVARMSTRPAFAAAFVGWSPIFAVQFAGAGHNDSMMIALVIVGLGFVGRRTRHVTGGLLALATFVKWLPLVIVPLEILEDRARRQPSLLPSLATGLVVAAGLSTLVFGWWWLQTFLPIVDSAASNELTSLAIWPRLAGSLPDVAVKVGPLVAFGVAYLFLLGQAWRGRARRGLAMGLFLVASPFLWTWYVVTPAALSAAEDDTPALWLAFGLSAYTGLYLGVSGNVLRVLFG